jgi:hypothetical protein
MKNNWLLALLLSGTLIAQDASYTKKSVHVYDTAMVITRAEFENRDLLDRFGRFVRSQCQGRQLARMIVSTKNLDLVRSTNTELPSVVGDLRTLERGLGPLNVAQVMCFGGQATALIRRGDSIERYQIAGNRDSLKVNGLGMDLLLVGLRLHPGADISDATHTFPDRVWLYAKTKDLPDIRRAATVHAALQRQIGIPTYLIVRTDSFFFDYDGPLCDVFEMPTPKISKSEFLARPFVVCHPDRPAQPCEVSTRH